MVQLRGLGYVLLVPRKIEDDEDLKMRDQQELTGCDSKKIAYTSRLVHWDDRKRIYITSCPSALVRATLIRLSKAYP